MKPRDLFNSSISLSIAAIVVKIIGALYKVPLSYMLGSDGMGYFNTAYSLFGFVFIITSGALQRAVTITVLDAFSAGGEKNGVALTDFVVKRFIMSIFTISFLIAVFSNPISTLLGNRKAGFSVLLITPAIFFSSLSNIYKGYLNAKLKLGTIAISQILEVFIKLAVGVLFAYIGVKKGFGVEIISGLAILGLSIGCFFSFLYVLVKYYNQKTKIKPAEFEFNQLLYSRFKNNLKALSITSLIMGLSSFLEVPLILQGLKLSGVEEGAVNDIYGIYSTLALPMLTTVGSIVNPITIESLPKLSILFSKNQKAEYKNLFIRSFSVILAVTVPLSLCFMLYGFEGLSFLFEDHMAVKGNDMLLSLIPAMILQTVFSLLIVCLESKGKVFLGSILSLLFVILKFSISLLLLAYCHFGILSIGFSMTISYCILIPLALILIRERNIIQPLFETASGITTISILSFVPLYLLIYAVGVISNGFFACAASVIISLFLYVFSISIIFNGKLKAK